MNQKTKKHIASFKDHINNLLDKPVVNPKHRGMTMREVVQGLAKPARKEAETKNSAKHLTGRYSLVYHFLIFLHS